MSQPSNPPHQPTPPYREECIELIEKQYDEWYDHGDNVHVTTTPDTFLIDDFAIVMMKWDPDTTVVNEEDCRKRIDIDIKKLDVESKLLDLERRHGVEGGWRVEGVDVVFWFAKLEPEQHLADIKDLSLGIKDHSEELRRVEVNGNQGMVSDHESEEESESE